MSNNIRRRAPKERVLLDTSPFAVREAFNHLRTNLMYTPKDDEEGCPVYAITSSGEATGKSTVIANLAIAYTKINKKVLVIDADMRCPVQHLIFEIENDKVGLSEILSSIVYDPHEAVRKTAFEGLDLIASGAIPPNPSELLLGKKFAALIEKFRYSYDVIFVDFPPIDIVTDAVATFDKITGYIFVVRSGRSDSKKVRAAMDTMERLGAKITGVVLNDANLKGSRSSYNYKYRRYGYSYYDTKRRQRSSANDNK
jgi:capsular exopolysaccharide synthesis family protein